VAVCSWRRSGFQRRPTLAERRISDRTVLIVAAAVVLAVIAFAWITDLIPPVREALSFQPLIVIGLIVATLAVLVIALRPRRAP
jgi:FtsH-binding integral membrane protein